MPDVDSEAMERATGAVRFFVERVSDTVGLPEGFWEDPYVFGFLVGAGILAAAGAGGGAAPGHTAAQAGIAAVAVVSGLEQAVITKQLAAVQDDEDADYIRGIGNAQKLMAVVAGYGGLEDDPDIVAARERAEEIYTPEVLGDREVSEEAKLLGALQLTLFDEVVLGRFGLEPE